MAWESWAGMVASLYLTEPLPLLIPIFATLVYDEESGDLVHTHAALVAEGVDPGYPTDDAAAVESAALAEAHALDIRPGRTLAAVQLTADQAGRTDVTWRG